MKRTYSILTAAVFTLMLALPLQGQTGTPKIQFDTADALSTTPSVTYAVQVIPAGSTTVPVFIVEKATCVAGSTLFGPSGSTCTVPSPASTLNKGDTITVSASNAGGTVFSAPLVDPGLSGNLGNIKIVIIIGS